MCGPGLKSLRPFDTLFLQSSGKASPDLVIKRSHVSEFIWRRWVQLIVIATTNTITMLLPHVPMSPSRKTLHQKNMQSKVKRFGRRPFVMQRDRFHCVWSRTHRMKTSPRKYSLCRSRTCRKSILYSIIAFQTATGTRANDQPWLPHCILQIKLYISLRYGCQGRPISRTTFNVQKIIQERKLVTLDKAIGCHLISHSGLLCSLLIFDMDI